MSTPLTRRTLFKAGAATLGTGLLLRLAVHPTPAGAASAKAVGFAPNPYLRITPDDVVEFAVARSDMGQGNVNMHAQLIAEELGVDPAKMSLVLVGADHAYDNPIIGVQMTGGSNATKTSWEPYRRAGATAREMLLAAAAAEWKVPKDALTVKDGAVLHAASGRTARFGALAQAAARQRVPSDVPLKQSGFTVIGQSLPRLDATIKLNGKAVFGMDVQEPDALVAVLVRSPVPGGTLKSFDGAKALALDGVKHVVRVPSGVAVVATTTWHAMQGAKAVTTDWDLGPVASVDSEQLLEKHRALLRDAKEGTRVHTAGRGEQGLTAPGVKVVEAEYAVPYLAHAPMEPQNATAIVRDGRIEVWAPTQGPGVALEALAEALDVDPGAITVHQTWVGGGFGRRGIMDFILEAAHTSKALKGTPVKVVWTREDDVQHSPYRPAATHLVRGALDGEGKIVAWHHRVVTQSIMAPVIKEFFGAMIPAAPLFLKRGLGALAGAVMPAKDQTAFEGLEDLPYELGGLAVDFVRHENGVPVLFWRSVGHSHTAFARECFVDELAHAAQIDPLRFRLDRLAKEPRQKAVLQLAAEKAGWGAPLPKGVGRGLALHKSFDTTAAAVAEVMVDDGEVRVTRLVMAADCGRAINPGIVKSQLESAAIFGLSAALHGEITFKEGRPQQSNFHDYAPLRLEECPVIEAHLVESTEAPTGIGEPGLPVVAPAVANALFAATGRRLRSLPFKLG